MKKKAIVQVLPKLMDACAKLWVVLGVRRGWSQGRRVLNFIAMVSPVPESQSQGCQEGKYGRHTIADEV